MVVALPGASGWLLYGSSVFAVDRVEVLGAQAEPVGEVLGAAGVADGTPLARLGLGAVADRVAALPLVASVEVERHWPSTVVLRVTERAPVALTRTTAGLRLVDGTGTAYAPAPGPPPPGLPELDTPQVTPGDPATAAALAVLAALPAALRPQVVGVHATSPFDVQLTLSGVRTVRTVRWGGAADSERKGAVLQPLLAQPGSVYDVAAPDLPTVRR